MCIRDRNSLLLFLVSAESDSISEQYQVLLKELEMYNPELLYKPRLLGVSKADLIDDELKELMKDDLPEDIAVHFFSSVTGQGVDTLKDMIWKELNG